MYSHNFPYKFPRWHQIGAQITQTGTALRFTGKNVHAIMVMLKIVSAPISIPLFQASASAGIIFCSTDAMCLKQGTLGTGNPSGSAGFLL